MKPRTYLAPTLLVAGSLALAASLQAQSVTGTPFLSNVSVSTLLTPPSALYAGWSGGAGLSSTSTGLRAQGTSYGSLYYVLPGDQVQTMSSSAISARLTFTVDNAANYVWVGTPFTLNDDSGSYNYGGLYSGAGNGGNPATVTWSGNTATWTVPLQAGQLAAVQGGNDHIYSIGLQFDPAVVTGGTYDVTFNSLELVPVPEPASFALFGFGSALLLAFRRRN